MKLSIHNFKTIRELNGFDFSSINIISGVNSSGKTSFIQFLLMLKQTLEAQSANPKLIFDKNLEYEDLVYKKNLNNSIEFEIQFDKKDIQDRFNTSLLQINAFVIIAKYSFLNGEVVLSNISLKYGIESKSNFSSIDFLYKDGRYNVMATDNLFGNLMPLVEKDEKEDVTIIKNLENGTLSFNSFFPLTFINAFIGEEVKTHRIIKFVNDYFSSISYIGPLRAEPNDFYPQNKKDKQIGKNGEFAAQFLEEGAKNEVEFYDIENKIIKTMLLSEAVKYWICDYFKLAKNITAEKENDKYKVKVINQYDVETTIRQVGFGISQVLPIIVEGLRMPKGGVLILEQPEIHLHPKVQSMLFDFIYSLSLTGKKFVIETHSDHFITRMRRRVAESNDNLAKQINLMFVEQEENEHKFVQLDLTNMGTFSYFPDDFVEQAEDDYKAIIKAQAEKRKSSKKI